MGAPKITLSAENDSTAPRYVDDMIGQLQRMVPGERYRELRYLLSVAQLSARQTADTIEKERSRRVVR